MGNTRIPTKIAEFDNYINNSADYLMLPSPPPTITNGLRLGLTADNVTNWDNARTDWNTLYDTYSNNLTRTKAVTASLADAREAFRAFAQPLLDIMAASPNATVDDEVALNFKIGRSEPSHPTVPIAEICIPQVQYRGQGVVKFFIRSEEGRRPAIVPAANIIEMRVKIGGEPPIGPNDGTEMVILNKAISQYNFGDENIGKRAWVFFRYLNTRYPALAGNYSAPVSFVIS